MNLSCRAIAIACALSAFVRRVAAQDFDISDLDLDDWATEAAFGMADMTCYEDRGEAVRHLGKYDIDNVSYAF